jgi:large subunit ribosomal protein L33
MAKKGNILVKLASSEDTGYFYVIKKNPKKIGNKKMSFKKYDPKVRKHVLFNEEKLK